MGKRPDPVEALVSGHVLRGMVTCQSCERVFQWYGRPSEIDEDAVALEIFTCLSCTGCGTTREADEQEQENPVASTSTIDPSSHGARRGRR